MGRQPAVVQSAPEDPLYLLDPANIPEPTFLHDKYTTATGALIGLGLPIYANYSKRRPLYAGIQVTIGTTLLGGLVGYLIQKKNQSYWADRDAILRHYVQLHPEDFPAKERVVIGDLMKPWIPIR